MLNRPATSRSNTLIALLACLAVVAILFFAREILIPIALAILLSFILAPLVNRFERWHFGRVLSVIVTVGLAGCLLLGVITIVFYQVTTLADQIPRYADNIKEKAKTFMPGPDSAISKFTRAADEVNDTIEEAATEIAHEADAAPSAAMTAPTVEEPQAPPVSVQVADRDLTPIETLAAFKPALMVFGTTAVVSVLVIFLLFERRMLRDRAIILAGQSRISITTVALEEAGRRISQYLLMQLLVNSLYGLPVMIGLWLIGVPSAFLWGLTAMLVRFIPYVGPWIGALPPIVLSLALFDSWMQPALVIGLFVVLELIVNNVVEPWLYGAQAGVSPLPLLIATLFWTWLWGPIGLLLAVPMTVCVAVVARHVPQLTFLNALLSDRLQLDPDAKFYQRALALDLDEAFEVVREYRDEHSLMEAFDHVILPAIREVEGGQQAGTIEAERAQAIHDGLRLLVLELGEDVALEGARLKHPSRSADIAVVCVPAQSDVDEIVAHMAGILLNERGFKATVIPAGALVNESVDSVDAGLARIVCVSTLPRSTIGQARHLCKRLLERIPDCTIVVGAWGGRPREQILRRIADSDRIQLATSLTEAVQIVATQINARQAPATAA